MAEGRGEDCWNHTASLLAQTYNINRPKGKAALNPDQLNPYRAAKEKKKQRLTTEKLMALKPLFVQENHGK